MGTARETTDPPETEFARYRSLPAMAGSRTAPGRAQACCLSRVNRGPDTLRTELPCHERARQSSLVAFCAKSCGNGSSLLALASARRRIPRTRVQKFCRRPSCCRKSSGGELTHQKSGDLQICRRRNYVPGLTDGEAEAAGEIAVFFSSRFALRASFSAFSASVNGPSFTIFASIDPSGIL